MMRHPHRRVFRWLIMALTIGLVACGGGSSSNDDAATTTTSNWDQMTWDQGQWQ